MSSLESAQTTSIPDQRIFHFDNTNFVNDHGKARRGEAGQTPLHGYHSANRRNFDSASQYYFFPGKTSYPKSQVCFLAKFAALFASAQRSMQYHFFEGKKFNSESQFVFVKISEYIVCGIRECCGRNVVIITLYFVEVGSSASRSSFAF